MPKYYEPKGDSKFGAFYLGEKDYSLFRFDEAKVVKESENTISIYGVGKAVGLMPQPKPFKVTFHKGTYQGWNSQKSTNEERKAYAVEEVIFDQLNDPDFPVDGFSGELEHKTDASEYSSDNPPLTNLTALDELKALPEIPASKGGKGGNRTYDPLAAINAKQTWYLQQFNECLKSAGIEDEVKSLVDVMLLKMKLDAKTAKIINEFSDLLLTFVGS